MFPLPAQADLGWRLGGPLGHSTVGAPQDLEGPCVDLRANELWVVVPTDTFLARLPGVSPKVQQGEPLVLWRGLVRQHARTCTVVHTRLVHGVCTVYARHAWCARSCARSRRHTRAGACATAAESSRPSGSLRARSRHPADRERERDRQTDRHLVETKHAPLTYNSTPQRLSNLQPCAPSLQLCVPDLQPFPPNLQLYVIASGQAALLWHTLTPTMHSRSLPEAPHARHARLGRARARRMHLINARPGGSGRLRAAR